MKQKEQNPCPLLSLLLCLQISRSYASSPSLPCFSLPPSISRPPHSFLSGRDERHRRVGKPGCSVCLCPGSGVEESLYFTQPKITSNLQTGIPRSTRGTTIPIKFLLFLNTTVLWHLEVHSHSYNTLWYFLPAQSPAIFLLYACAFNKQCDVIT